MKQTKKEIENHLKGITHNLPDQPGIYQFLDDKAKIIYVGKAKNLKRRVSSYFNKEHKENKTKVLVRRVRNIKYIVVRTEEDALLLENSLIKEHQPRYNVLLKDDKTYPSICVQNEYFPRVFKTRKIIQNGSRYYGPYTHMPTMNLLLDLIKRLYPIRNCNLNLAPEHINSRKYKVCLQYHIDLCAGPCVGKQTEKEYLDNIKEIEEILKGNTRDISNKLKSKMEESANMLDFENAQRFKEKATLIDNYRSKSEVVSTLIHNIDVFTIESAADKAAYINYLHIANGSINQAYTFEYRKKLAENDNELLKMGIIEMRKRYGSKAKEIILEHPIDLNLEGIKTTIPQRGEKKKLLDLSKLNVKQYKADRLKQAEKLNPAQRSTRLLKEIQDMLKLEKLPMHIESFDNSNIQGSDPVAACIVFRNGKPAKNEYRRYNIKTVEGPDDYASMREVTKRRYSRLVKEKASLPDLIITDGGKGQMSSVKETLDDLGIDIPIAGLAKDDKHKTSELLFGFPTKSVGLEPNSALFRLLERLQDEVHRFAIQFHREKRSNRQVKSELDEIKGIGPKTKETLLKKYKSVKRIREASEKELTSLIGQARTKALIKGLYKEK